MDRLRQWVKRAYAFVVDPDPVQGVITVMFLVAGFLVLFPIIARIVWFWWRMWLP